MKPAPLDPSLVGIGRSQREDALESPETFSGMGETVERLVEEHNEWKISQIEEDAAAPALFEVVDLDTDLLHLERLEDDATEMPRNIDFP